MSLPVARTLHSAAAFNKQLPGMRPTSALAATAAGERTHGDTRQVRLKRLPRAETQRAADESLDSPSSRQVEEEASEPPRSTWKSSSLKRHNKRIREARKRCLRRENCWFFLFFFQSTSYSYRLNPMDYILFVPLSL